MEYGTASRDGASSDGMGRRNGSDEGGDGKADAGVGGYGRVGTTLWVGAREHGPVITRGG